MTKSEITLNSDLKEMGVDEFEKAPKKQKAKKKEKEDK